MPLNNDEEIEAEGSRVSECLSSVYLPLVFSWSTSSFLLRQLFLRPGGHEGSEGGRRGKGDEGMKETGERCRCGADALAKFVPRIQGITFCGSVGLIVIPLSHLQYLRVH